MQNLLKPIPTIKKYKMKEGTTTTTKIKHRLDTHRRRTTQK